MCSRLAWVNQDHISKTVPSDPTREHMTVIVGQGFIVRMAHARVPRKSMVNGSRGDHCFTCESWKNKVLKIRGICFCAVSYFSKSLEEVQPHGKSGR